MSSKITLFALLFARTFIIVSTGICNECKHFKSDEDCKAALLCMWADDSCDFKSDSEAGETSISGEELPACTDRDKAHCKSLESFESLTTYC
jgi:hypothetical protein